MSNAINKVRKILEGLPKNATFEEIQYHIYVRSKIERGMKDVAEGRTLTQEEVERRMAKWLEK